MPNIYFPENVKDIVITEIEKGTETKTEKLEIMVEIMVGITKIEIKHIQCHRKFSYIFRDVLELLT